MKRVKAIVEIDLGLFTDQEDKTRHRFLDMVQAIEDVSRPIEPIEFTVTDIDTQLITAHYVFAGGRL